MLAKMVKGELPMQNLIIEQKLNNLFYLPCKPELETEMILQQAKQKQSKKRTGLHLSAILESDNKFCYREQVLSLFYEMHQGENIHTGLKRIFTAGNFIGEKYQRLFIRGGLGQIDKMDMTYFNPDYDLYYTPDAEITIAKIKYIVEIKSQNTFQFQKATSHPGGRKQVRMYMWLRKIKNGFVLVEDKNTQNIKIFPEQYKETFGREELLPYIERLEGIQEYKQIFLESKQPPKRICRDCNTKRALECNMRDACFNIGKGRIKLK